MDFYSCPEFRDGNQHSKFYVNYEEQHQARLNYIKMRIGMDWVTKILKTTGLKSQVLATDLFNFFLEQGYVDLRLKYGLSSTHRLITNLYRTKQASTREEKEIAAFLKPLFAKAREQQGIRYKLRDEKESIAIVDLIVFDDKTVYLLEIKRHPYNITQNKALNPPCMYSITSLLIVFSIHHILKGIQDLLL